MLVLIDNFDSFTYNIFHAFASLGVTVCVRRNDEIDINDPLLDEADHIVIGPGPGSPHHAELSNQIIESYTKVKPILGICLGHQCIAKVFGAVVTRANYPMHGKVCQMLHQDKGIFRGLQNPFMATRYHSLVVDGKTLPCDLEVTAVSETGEVMGIKHRYYATEGIQFHPESVMTKGGIQLLSNFLSLS